jgi:hypothetical protein
MASSRQPGRFRRRCPQVATPRRCSRCTRRTGSRPSRSGTVRGHPCDPSGRGSPRRPSRLPDSIRSKRAPDPGVRSPGRRSVRTTPLERSPCRRARPCPRCGSPRPLRQHRCVPRRTRQAAGHGVGSPRSYRSEQTGSRSLAQSLNPEVPATTRQAEGSAESSQPVSKDERCPAILSRLSGDRKSRAGTSRAGG